MFNVPLFIGEYWIDPNEGDIKDAILVKCDLAQRLTCLLPRPAVSPHISRQGEGEFWLSDLQTDFSVGMTTINSPIKYFLIHTYPVPYFS